MNTLFVRYNNNERDEGIRMYNKIKVLLAMVACLVLGVALAVLGLNTRSKLKNAKDITKFDKFVAGEWVKGTTDEVIDWYCNETSEKNGKKTENFRWYYCWFTSINYPDGGYIGVKVPASEFDNYEKLKNSNLEYELTFQGELKSCDGDIAKYKQQFEKEWQKQVDKEYGTTGYKISDYCPNYYIELKTTKQGNIMMIIGGLLLLVGVVTLVCTILASRKEKKDENDYYSQKMGVNGLYGVGGNSVSPYGANGVNTGTTDLTTGGVANANVGAAAGYNSFGEQDELSKMLAEEDQKVSEYNFQTNLTGSDRVEDDK